MSRGGNKLKYQTEKALKSINYIGTSKKEYRDNGIETGIHSIKQMKHALSVSQNFVKWIKDEKCIHNLYQLKRVHYRDYIEHMRAKGVSIGHLRNIETNLRLLAKGMDKISATKCLKVRDWIPAERIVKASEKAKPNDRSYSREEIEMFYEKMSDRAKIAADLQIAFGLRLREVSKTRVAHIEEKNSQLFWIAVEDRSAINTAKGVTKAGRPRTTSCLPRYEERIRMLVANKKHDEIICPLTYNALKNAYYRAGVSSGSHGFRHTYSCEMLKLELEKQDILKQGTAMIQRMLENKAAGYRKDYLVLAAERPLYRKVNEIVDLIHGYLGHGKGRMDLCEVYMQGIL